MRYVHGTVRVAAWCFAAAACLAASPAGAADLKAPAAKAYETYASNATRDFLARSLKTAKATLINVPLVPTGKVDLRIYMFESPYARFTVRLFAEPSGDQLAERQYQWIGVTDPPAPAHTPVVVDASSIFRPWIADQVRVVIETDSGSFWPLLTVTNRRNNQITVISPQ